MISIRWHKDVHFDLWIYSVQRWGVRGNTLDQLNYKFSLETGQAALDGEGSIRLEQDLSTGEPQFLMNEDFTESAIQTQSSYASNTDLDTEAGFDTSSALDDILDFTERNPFGDEDSA